jgi:uncharacterized protein YndB with AHSA1/START domain
MWSVESSRTIDGSPSEIWDRYADPGTWPRWGHSTRAAEADGPLAVGSVVTIRPTRGPTQRVRIVAFEPERRLASELAMPGARMRFQYVIEPLASGCLIRHQVAMEGPLAGLLGRFMRASNERKLAIETARLADDVRSGR